MDSKNIITVEVWEKHEVKGVFLTQIVAKIIDVFQVSDIKEANDVLRFIRISNPTAYLELAAT